MKLSTADKKNLSRFEDTIKKGLDKAKGGWIDVATALARIQEGKLHRATHANFEDYCRQKWGISRQRAHQLIQAVGMSTQVDSEKHARALLGLDPTEAETVLALAGAAGAISTVRIQTARQLLEEETKDLPPEEKAEKQRELIAEAEQEAERPPAGPPRRKSRIAGVNGLVKDIEVKLRRCKTLHAGLPDVAGPADKALDEVQSALDIYADIVRSSQEEKLAA